jgi:hypothetical protein
MRSLTFVALTSFLLFAACKDDKLCAPGATQPCACPGGIPGAQPCAADGARWEACACPGGAAASQTPSTTARAPKAEQCTALIKVINAGTEILETGGKADGGVGELRSMADTMDKMGADAAKVEVTIVELKTYAAEYQTMAREVAKAARDMAAAAEAKDAKRINAAQAAMDAAIKKEDTVVDAINKFCQQP